MKKINQFLFGIFICLFFYNCDNNDKTIYNEKANEIILQTVKKSNCNCLLEIPKKSMIEMSKVENPHFDIQDFLITKLGLNNYPSLDSLVITSQNFNLNLEMIKKNNIKIITLKNLEKTNLNNINSIYKICPKGIFCIRKPIFNKDYTKVAIDFNFAFYCGRAPIVVYELKKGKWVKIKQ